MSETEKDGVQIVNDILGRIGPGKQTLVKVAQEMVGDEKKISFVVENRLAQAELPKPPVKQESPRRAHEFYDAKGFAAYLLKYKTDDTVVLVNVEKQQICGILNEKAENGFETITLQPMVHPLFAPWLRLMGAKLELPAFCDFLTQNRRAVINPESKELILMLSQVKVSKKITLQRGFGKHSINGIVCEMDIMGQSKSEELNLPDFITIEVPLYLDTEPTQFEIDLTIDVEDEDIVVKCSSADLLEKRVRAFEAMLDIVEAIGGVTVAMGQPAHRAWDYLGNRNGFLNNPY